MEAKIMFRVRNQSISRADPFHVVAGSRNYLRAEFEFLTPEWTEEKTAIFRYGGGEKLVLLEDGACEVPWEALAEPGIVFVSVFSGDLITADTAQVRVYESGYTEGTAPGEPTPDIYAQLLSAYDTAKTSAKAAEAIAEDSRVSSAAAAEAAESASASTKSAEKDAEMSKSLAEDSQSAALAAEASAKAAQSSAASAQSDAEAAASDATVAKTAAEAAKASAESSYATAEKANTTAENARAAAEAAKATADSVRDDADAGVFKGERGERGEQGERGETGKSAYEYARSAGYSGDEAQFASELSRVVGILDGNEMMF